MTGNGSIFPTPPPGKVCVPVFDLGGVLLDWNPRYLFGGFFARDPRGLERFLVEIDFWKWNAAMDRGRPFAEAVSEWSAKFPRYAEMIRAFDVRWVETVGGTIPGMVGLLSRLNRSGCPLFVLSNTSAEKLPVLRARFSFLGLFRRIVTSGEAGVNKPEPGIFAFFLDRTGRRKEELLLIDDVEENVHAARRSGWDAVRFHSAEQLKKEFSRRGIF